MDDKERMATQLQQVLDLLNQSNVVVKTSVVELVKPEHESGDGEWIVQISAILDQFGHKHPLFKEATYVSPQPAPEGFRKIAFGNNEFLIENLTGKCHLVRWDPLRGYYCDRETEEDETVG
jgi:hypothetical protein